MLKLKEIYIHNAVLYRPTNKKIDEYLKELEKYLDKNKGHATESHIDTLIILYRVSGYDRPFEKILNLHKNLLKMLIQKAYTKHKGILKNDEETMLVNSYFELFRRVLYYNPKTAPFSKWFKIYMKLWIRGYLTEEAKQRNRLVLESDLYGSDKEEWYNKQITNN